jgi:hypothetical protein
MAFGVANTNMDDQEFGILKTLGGSAKAGQQAMDFANQLYPQVEEVDPWEAAFQFFSEMGRAASQPGATVLGSAVGSMQVPMDYLNAKKKEKRETDRARLQTAVQIAPSLKPKPTGAGSLSTIAKLNADLKAGRITPEQHKLAISKATNVPDGSSGAQSPLGKLASDLEAGLITQEQFQAQFDKLTDLGGSGGSGAESPLGKLAADLEAGRITQEQFQAQFDKLTDLGDSDSGPKPFTELAKLYDDLSLAEVGSEEATNIQKQIDAIAKKGGFDKEIFGAESDLRKEWKKFENPYDEIEIKHQKLVSALERQTGVGDMSAIFVYMKMLDPGSVVRESEFAQAQQTAGAFETIRVRMAQIAEGDKLSEDQRKEFLALAEEFRNLSKFYVGQNRLDLGTIVANNPALKPSNIFGSELAPPNFYLDTSVFRQANSLGFTMDEVWEGMTDEEKADYLPTEDN